MRLAAFYGGGDWADASCKHLVLPPGVDVEAERDACRDYYLYQYLPKMGKPGAVPYLSFEQWLVDKCGSREPTAEELEEYWDV